MKRLLCWMFNLQMKPGTTVVRMGRTLPLPEMNAQLMKNALCVEDGNGLWQALHQVLDDQRAEVMAEAVSVENAGRAELQSYYAGGYQHLDKLQQWLLDARASARRQLDS